MREVLVPIRPAKKTRPPAEYDACAALPCPDIEIGLRRPVNHRVHGRGAGRCDPLHSRPKKSRLALEAGGCGGGRHLRPPRTATASVPRFGVPMMRCVVS